MGDQVQRRLQKPQGKDSSSSNRKAIYVERREKPTNEIGDNVSRRSNRLGLYTDPDDERRPLLGNEIVQEIIQQGRKMEAKTQNAVSRAENLQSVAIEMFKPISHQKSKCCSCCVIL
ncbi:uncharacterized protein LOC127871408 [Dreissena polymorpha]|uniref:uncharacterized protein LOC127871408 n=1 Tax=Dreissena polymorpha TaxID=45954 RepID=UPI0022654238|nr:uncharacterized protein LOC127871408 [Dreissena polymorpha]